MNRLNFDGVYTYVNAHLDQFYKQCIVALSSLTLKRLINRNPYLFTTRRSTTANELIQEGLQTFISATEEKMFGVFLAGLSIEVATQTTGGHKSIFPGMDFEFENNDSYYLMSIKSRPNWGNPAQRKKLAQDFATAEIALHQSNSSQTVQKVLGICYGKAKTSRISDGYIKVVGQNFWALISGDKNLYIDIVEPIEFKAREHTDAYFLQKTKTTNLLTKEFLGNYCNAEGFIDWPKLLEMNSGNYDLDQFFK